MEKERKKKRVEIDEDRHSEKLLDYLLVENVREEEVIFFWGGGSSLCCIGIFFWKRGQEMYV